MEDTSNLKLFLTIASYIGTFPYKNFCKKFWGAYVCCWCLLAVLLNISSVMYEIGNKDGYFFYILPIIVYVEWIVLNVQCSQNAIYNVRKWKKVLSAFSKYDEISPNVPKKSNMNVYFFIVGIIAVNMSLLIGSPSFEFNLDLLLSLEINWLFHLNLLELLYAIILENLTLLQKRYKQIKEEVATWNRGMMVPKDRLGNLIERYRILYEIGTSIDEIFGKVVLILLANTFSITIDLIGIMLNTKVGLVSNATVQYILHCMIMVATAAYILSRYDSTEKVGNEIVKFYCIHESFNGATTVSLVKYFDELSPRFTADGYFALNKTVVPSLLAGIATYTVVMLQLMPKLQSPVNTKTN